MQLLSAAQRLPPGGLAWRQALQQGLQLPGPDAAHPLPLQPGLQQQPGICGGEGQQGRPVEASARRWIGALQAPQRQLCQLTDGVSLILQPFAPGAQLRPMLRR